LQVLGTAALIMAIGYGLGLGLRLPFAAGLILAMSSTAIVLQSLQERGKLKTPGGEAAFAVLLFQDISVIPVLALLPLLAVTTAQPGETAPHTGIATLSGGVQALVIVAAVAGIVLAGRYVINPLFRAIAKTQLRELFTAAALLLVIGVSESAKFNNAIVAIKVTVLTAFILVGGFILLKNLPTYIGNWDPFIPPPTGVKGEFGWSGILRAASIVFFAYIGFEAVSTAGQEAKNPGKDMPFGIIGSLVACTVIYILVSIVLTMIVSYKSLNVPDPVAVAVDAFGPQWGWFAKTIKIGAIIGLTSVVLVLMYAQTRIFYTMARDGLLPKIFATVHQTFRTPWINTILVGLITACAAGFFDINTLGDMTSVGTLAAFAIVCLTVIWLRRTHPDIPRGYRVPLYPVLPALGIISCIALIFTVETRVLIFFAWYTGAMIILYFVYGMHNSQLAKGHQEPATGEPALFPEDEPLDESGKPVLRP